MRSVTAADDADGVMIPLLQLAPHIQKHRRVVNLAQKPRIEPVLLCQQREAALRDLSLLTGEVDLLLPFGNGLRIRATDAFDLREFTGARAQHRLRAAKALQQPPCAHRTDLRQQIQRQIGLSAVHGADSVRSDVSRVRRDQAAAAFSPFFAARAACSGKATF